MMRSYQAFAFAVGWATVLQATAISQLSNDSFFCAKEGRFVVPDDCGSYIECVSDNGGHLMSHKRSCHGKAFDPQTATCTETTRVKGCHVRGSRHFVYTASKFDDLCKDSSVHFTCGDCGTQVTCISGKAFETKCETNMGCNENIPNFNGGVCHLLHDKRCSCNAANTYHKDPYSDQGFFFCQDENSPPKLYNCPQGMTFDEGSKMCLNQYGAPACTGKGIFAYPNTCHRYYMCTFALEGWIQTELECNSNELFNEQTKVCENPCDWPLKEFSCELQGRFGNPQNCRRFYECIDDGQGSFIQVGRTCPPSYYWSDESQTCISEDDSKCIARKEGPIDRCRDEYENICSENGAAPNGTQGNAGESGGGAEEPEEGNGEQGGGGEEGNGEQGGGGGEEGNEEQGGAGEEGGDKGDNEVENNPSEVEGGNGESENATQPIVPPGSTTSTTVSTTPTETTKAPEEVPTSSSVTDNVTTTTQSTSPSAGTEEGGENDEHLSSIFNIRPFTPDEPQEDMIPVLIRG